MDNFSQHFLTLADGLELAYRRYGPNESTKAPLLCLAGLTRNARDFHDMASALCRDRTIIAPDMRGRGLSGYPDDISTYSVPQELWDVFALLDALDLPSTIVIGTSRGGLLAMTMAVLAPHRLAGCVLNDIGPEVNKSGLERIMSYVGKGVPPATWEEAVQQTKAVNADQFPTLTDAQWLAVVKNLYSEAEDGSLTLDYDPRISEALAAQAASGELVDACPLFDALKNIPTLCIRGANSDILAAEGLEAMAERRPDLMQVTIQDRGHAPFLNEPDALEAIEGLLEVVDG